MVRDVRSVGTKLDKKHTSSSLDWERDKALGSNELRIGVGSVTLVTGVKGSGSWAGTGDGAVYDFVGITVWGTGDGGTGAENCGAEGVTEDWGPE